MVVTEAMDEDMKFSESVHTVKVTISSALDGMNKKIYLVGGRDNPSHGIDNILELDTYTGDVDDTQWMLYCSKTWRSVPACQRVLVLPHGSGGDDGCHWSNA